MVPDRQKVRTDGRKDRRNGRTDVRPILNIRPVYKGPLIRGQVSEMKKVNKQCLLDTPRTVRVSEKTWQLIVRTR